MSYLDSDDDVFVLDLGERGLVDTEGRMRPDRVAEVGSVVDEQEWAGR